MVVVWSHQGQPGFISAPEGGYSQEQLEDQTRKHSWEKGHIDYMGIDSFQYIQMQLDAKTGKPVSSVSQGDGIKLDVPSFSPRPVLTGKHVSVSPQPEPVKSVEQHQEKIVQEAQQVVQQSLQVVQQPKQVVQQQVAQQPQQVVQQPQQVVQQPQPVVQQPQQVVQMPQQVVQQPQHVVQQPQQVVKELHPEVPQSQPVIHQTQPAKLAEEPCKVERPTEIVPPAKVTEGFAKLSIASSSQKSPVVMSSTSPMVSHALHAGASGISVKSLHHHQQRGPVHSSSIKIVTKGRKIPDQHPPPQ